MKKLGPRKGTCLALGYTINLNWSRTKGPHTSLLRDVIPSGTL